MLKNISRREFITASGAAAGLAAFASMGIYSGWGKNEPEISTREMESYKL